MIIDLSLLAMVLLLVWPLLKQGAYTRTFLLFVSAFWEEASALT